MKTLSISVLAAGAAALFVVTPITAANAQSDGLVAVSTTHGNWTLKERENWLHDRLEKSKDDGSISHGEYDRVKDELGDIHHDEDAMRDHHDG
jgi:hypothetical protein